MNKTLLAAIAASTISATAGDFVCQGFLGNAITVDGEQVNAGLIYGTFNGVAWNGFCLNPHLGLGVGVTYPMDVWSTPLFMDPQQEAGIEYVVNHAFDGTYSYPVEQATVWKWMGNEPTGDPTFEADVQALYDASVNGSEDRLFGILHCSTTRTQDLTYAPEPGAYALLAGIGLVAFGVWRRR